MAESTRVLQAEIVAKDQASGPIARIAASLKGLDGLAGEMGRHAAGMGSVMRAAFGNVEHAAAGAGHQAHRAGREMTRASQTHGWTALSGHITLLRGHFGALGETAKKAAEGVSALVPALAGLGAAGSLAGMFEMINKSADGVAQIAKSAASVGTSFDGFERLAYAAKMTDVPIESMSTGMFRLNRAIADSVAGKNKDAAALFAHLGIRVRDANGHLLSAEQLLPKLADAFQHTTDPAMRARMAMVLFGRGGKDMLPLLSQGGGALAEFARQADAVRYPFSAEEREQMEGYHRSMMTLGAAVTGFTDAISAKLAPVLTPIIDDFTKWITANRDWIATGIAGAVTGLAASLSQIDIHAEVESFGHWASTILTLGGHVSALEGGMGLLAAVVAGPAVAAIGMMVSAVGSIGGALRGLVALVAANPVLAIAAGIGFAAYEIYEHWDAVKGFFVDLWHGITAVFEEAWQKIKPIVDGLERAVGWAKSIGAGIGNAVSQGAAQGAEFGELGAMVPSPGPTDTAPPAIPSPYRPGAPSAAAAPAQNGKVDVHVKFDNAPAGTRVATAASGAAAKPAVDVGYNAAGAAGAF